VGSNLTEGGNFFPRKEPPPGHGCVYVFQGLTVGWWKATLFQHHRVQIPAEWASHGCCVVFVLYRPERRKEKRGWDRKVPDWPGYVACSSSTCNSPSVQFGMHSRPEEDRQYQRETAIAPVHRLLMSPQYLGTGITS
jgi:hypothetical protein